MAIDIRGEGSTKAIAELLQPPLNKFGKVMWPEDRAVSLKMMAASRELLDMEVEEFVAQHAVALYVHRDNPLPGLTTTNATRRLAVQRSTGSGNSSAIAISLVHFRTLS